MEHNSLNHTKAKKALRHIASSCGSSYSKIKKMFVERKCLNTTNLFWVTLFELYPDMAQYNNVAYCQCCSSFLFSYDPNFQLELVH